MTQTQPAQIEIPEPSYRPTFSLAEQLQNDQRGPEAQLMPPSQETIIDNGWDRWHLMVMPGENPDRMTLQLLVADHITWWKKIEVKVSFFNTLFTIRTLGTQDDDKDAAVDLRVSDAPGSGVLHLDFWKAGFLGFGSFVFSHTLHLPSYLGNRVVYLCSRDHPSQP